MYLAEMDIARIVDGFMGPTEASVANRNYLCAFSPTGAFRGTFAIHYNKVVLVNSALTRSRSALISGGLALLAAKDFIEEVERRGHRVILIPKQKMNALRASLPANSPNATNLRLARTFRSYLGNIAYTFPELDHPNDLINYARIINSFKHRGINRCAVSYRAGREKGPVIKLFETVDDGLLYLLKNDSTTELKLLEISRADD
jgi:hypothetical protein